MSFAWPICPYFVRHQNVRIGGFLRDLIDKPLHSNREPLQFTKRINRLVNDLTPENPSTGN
jgi:hypothetical protein